MTRDEIRSSLQQPYNRENWTQVVRNVFGKHVRLNSSPQSLPTEDESIKSIAQIGDVTLDDGRNLAVIEVEVSDDINLLRNRVSLRNRVARFIDQDKAHGVLAVFSSKHPEYRFTFTAKESLFDEDIGMVERETATKRFTYVLGPSETCTTAATRFEHLSHKSEHLRLDDVVEAFSVEKLNKEFFNTYKDHYQTFCKYLLSDNQKLATYRYFEIESVDEEAEQAKLEKPVRDFVKRLLGRIVFLHFLQKKGWLGCPSESELWKGGDPDFLRSYFAQCDNKDRFHSLNLVPLFYGALNTPDRPNDIFEFTGTRIPYLNGGLFEPLIRNEASIDLPSNYFEHLLEFFSHYNFTIDENDPDEHEVGIDPEMLGHIFENLLEDNKDKGAYYTPKAIVHYMCQQSLIYYLLTHLGETEDSKAAIEYLVRTKQIGEKTEHGSYIRSHAAKIEKLLDRVKICDPAIGSGAFPIGILQEIFWLKLTLDLTLNDPTQLADIKRNIIQNSIYGVDVDAGAVDIARLRFWLSLVVDEDSPRPLPNLDYKIMQGDSLLESFEGVPLKNLDEEENLGGVTISPKDQVEMDFLSPQMVLTAKENADRITQLIRGYFSETNPASKQVIHQEIDRFVLHHIDYNLNLADVEFRVELQKNKAEINRKQEQLPNWKPPAKTTKRMTTLEKLIRSTADKKSKLEELEHKAERPYFLWHLFFQDVFEQGGFDIVIANPPYVRQETIKDYKPLIEAEGYECYKGTADLFVYFYERSVKLLRDKGVLTYITSNKYYRSGYGEKLRGYLAKNLKLREMLDFGDAPVFDAIAYASILIGAKESINKKNNLKGWNWKRGEKVSRIVQIMEEQAFELQQANLTNDGWRLDMPEVYSLLTKLRSKGTALGDYVEGKFFNGIKTGLNEAFDIPEDIHDQLIAESDSSTEILKPFLRGREVKQWKPASTNRFIIKIESSENKKHPWSGLPPNEAEEVFKHTYPAVYRRFNDPERRKALIKRYDQGKYFWELRSCAYWGQFEEPKVIIPAIQISPQVFADRDSYYSNNKSSFCVTHDAEFVSSILNSNVSKWFAIQVFATKQNNNFDFDPRYSRQFPIPVPNKEAKRSLTDLAKSAAKADVSSLPSIEDEINQIVYKLFDLTPDEIRLIESSIQKPAEPSVPGEHGKTKQKDSLFRRLSKLAESKPYLSFDYIKNTVRKDKIAENDDLLREYLSEAAQKGLVHSAGRGWYSRLESELPLDTEALEPLVQVLEKRFPALPICCWNTQQLNPYLEHLVAKPTVFVTVERDAMESVCEHLRQSGFNAVQDPRGKATKHVTSSDGLVIVRPGSVWEAYSEGPCAPWEVLLVDAWKERERLGFIDLGEFHDMLVRLFPKGRIQISSLLAYLKKSKIPTGDFFGENQPIIGE